LANSNSVLPDYEPQRRLIRSTLPERIYESLREDILSNRLPPDTPLLEVDISTAFDVSRGPVREALLRLAAEGLVTVVPRRGAIVTSLSKEEFLDSYSVREALEVLAVRLATPMVPHDLEKLERLQQKMVEAETAGDVEAFFTANMAFHTLIVDLSGNKKLREIYHPLVNQMRRYSLSSLSLRGGLHRSCEEHQAILNAIRSGEAEEAGRLLGEHIRVPQQILKSDERAELVPRAYRPVDAEPDGKSWDIIDN
jgi:GntR family transcriptional regulator, rspAB operon transcriptional repressor